VRGGGKLSPQEVHPFYRDGEGRSGLRRWGEGSNRLLYSGRKGRKSFSVRGRRRSEEEVDFEWGRGKKERGNLNFSWSEGDIREMGGDSDSFLLCKKKRYCPLWKWRWSRICLKEMGGNLLSHLGGGEKKRKDPSHIY